MGCLLLGGLGENVSKEKLRAVYVVFLASLSVFDEQLPVQGLPAVVLSCSDELIPLLSVERVVERDVPAVLCVVSTWARAHSLESVLPM